MTSLTFVACDVITRDVAWETMTFETNNSHNPFTLENKNHIRMIFTVQCILYMTSKKS